ncbi:MAG: anthranilate synthase component I family protein [Candidatus Cyclobacteriaceae bacterium M2_1C_046]
MRKSQTFEIVNDFRKKAVYWASQKDIFAYTNPCRQNFPFGGFNEILAADAIEVIEFNDQEKFDQLKNKIQDNPDWYFGYFGYDLKNELEDLSSNHPSRTGDQDIFFFRPKYILFFKEGIVEIFSSMQSPEELFKEINQQQIPSKQLPSIAFNPVISKEQYIQKVKDVKDHILEGDIYELNLCMEFYAKDSEIDPFTAYLQLIESSPTPFSGYFRNKEHYLICASPERFLRKSGNELISQPIKGTIRRSPDPEVDEQLKEQLRQDEKERAENMMIVDLVRNDLARSSEFGSVKVEEIFGIYPFRQWYQMISTISSKINPGIHFVDAIKNAFPMGSMTGAPKIKVMQLIEKYEVSKRGVYSGAFGYITPDGDFDFNVVIRSLLYNEATKILSFEVGSAITFDAIPEKEHDECLLKAEAIFSIFR